MRNHHEGCQDPSHLVPCPQLLLRYRVACAPEYREGQPHPPSPRSVVEERSVGVLGSYFRLFELEGLGVEAVDETEEEAVESAGDEVGLEVTPVIFNFVHFIIMENGVTGRVEKRV